MRGVPSWCRSRWHAYVVNAVCCRLNLLIAIMGDSYEKVKESERVEALRERARIIVEAERTHPGRHNYYRYMHFVEAADSSEPAPQEWEGITGRVKQLNEEQERRIEEKIDKKNDEVMAEIKRLEASVDSKIDGKIDGKIEEVKADMREIKDLLASMVSKAK